MGIDLQDLPLIWRHLKTLLNYMKLSEVI
jgi:hypothetical protein